MATGETKSERLEGVSDEEGVTCAEHQQSPHQQTRFPYFRKIQSKLESSSRAVVVDDTLIRAKRPNTT
ncbi:hypothetical protein ACFFQF_13005 [Haladaptatus pallidirubidus]|uniref:hypothetical protein n=1 Tax=Haladaptatus pallidirubidus TaxID=1008152 RepID=UPI001D11DF51|nr:hypothetical protein [Haladaptatus pallidirubidus]